MIPLKIWILKKTANSLLVDAIQTNDHILADKLTLLIDALREGGWNE